MAYLSPVPQVLDLSALDFAQLVRPGETVLWGQATAEPLPLTQALLAQRHAIGPFNVFLGIGTTDTVQLEHADTVHFAAYCGTGHRVLAKAGKLDILPCHYSHLPTLIASGRLKIDVVLLQVAPPNEAGQFSYGVAQEYLPAAVERARIVIAEVNAAAPWTHGVPTLSPADIDYIVETSRPVAELKQPAPGPVELAIARHVSGLVGDGATLQFGIGVIPEAILAALAGHRDLGIHSGAIGDRAADLMARGVITNAKKAIDPGVTVTGLMLGTKALFDFAHRNPQVQLRTTDYTHGAPVLAKIDNFVALNSAIEVDLTGQINAETVGGVYVGAVGGALDFLRAAHASKGGVPVVALPSTAGKTSRIVAALSGPVSTPRSDAAVIVTEHGVADLRGLTLEQRRVRMLAIAHPDHREALERSAAQS